MKTTAVRALGPGWHGISEDHGRPLGRSHGINKYLLPIGLNGSKTESQLTIFNSEIVQQNCSPVHPGFLERSRFKPCLRPLPVAVCIRLYLRDLHAVAIGWDEGP